MDPTGIFDISFDLLGSRCRGYIETYILSRAGIYGIPFTGVLHLTVHKDSWPATGWQSSPARDFPCGTHSGEPGENNQWKQNLQIEE